MEIVGGLPRYRKIISEFTELVIEILLNSYRRFFSMSSCMRNNVYVPMVGVSEDPGGVLLISSDRMIEWGQKKKILGLQTKPPKNPRPDNPKSRNISFEYPQKSLLKSSHPQNTGQNFPTQKNREIENFKAPKNPSIIPVT